MLINGCSERTWKGELQLEVRGRSRELLSVWNHECKENGCLSVQARENELSLETPALQKEKQELCKFKARPCFRKTKTIMKRGKE